MMKYYLYGAGSNCRTLLSYMNNTKIEAIIDRDDSIIGKELNSIRIISMESFLDEMNNDSYVFVTTIYNYEEIEAQFAHNGIINYGFCPWMDQCILSIDRIIQKYDINSLSSIWFSSNNPITNEIISRLNCTKEIRFMDKDEAIGQFVFLTDRFYVNQGGNKIIDLLHDKLMLSRNNLSRFKNKHKNEICFIIGNGPSLRYEDLELLHSKKKICFGVNRVYLGYKYTNWRPDYHVFADQTIIRNDFDNIVRLNSIKFVRSQENIEGVFCFNNLLFEYHDSDFSLDIVKGIYNGFTVIYECIQLAVYMGFTTIYLLGVDMPIVRRDAAEEGQHFYHTPNENEALGKGNRDGAIAAFRVADRITSELGVDIFNATRGGDLEVFERVEMDELISQL